MKGRSIAADDPYLPPDILDHSREFVAVVYRRAPAEYEALAATERFALLLREENSFNHGKLYAYAEYAVFRREFHNRFPEAPPAACINAFSRLFLKNDISMTNLVSFIESQGDQKLL